MTILAAVALGCSACAPKTNAGHVELSRSDDKMCAPAEPDQQRVVGEFVTTSDTPVTVTGVTLAGAKGLRVLDSYLLPPDGGDSILMAEYPPSEPSWRQRKPAVGAEIAARESYNVVLRVVRTSGTATGRASGLVLSYRYGKRTSEVTGTLQYVLATDCSAEA